MSDGVFICLVGIGTDAWTRRNGRERRQWQCAGRQCVYLAAQRPVRQILDINIHGVTSETADILSLDHSFALALDFYSSIVDLICSIGSETNVRCSRTDHRDLLNTTFSCVVSDRHYTLTRFCIVSDAQQLLIWFTLSVPTSSSEAVSLSMRHHKPLQGRDT